MEAQEDSAERRPAGGPLREDEPGRIEHTHDIARYGEDMPEIRDRRRPHRLC